MIMASFITKKLIKAKNSIIKARARPRLVEYLPIEMITEIVARVGATSAPDLFRCKQTCKILCEITEEKKVLQQVAMEGLYPCTWRNNDKAQPYFDRCRDCNNPQALYQLGMEQYFSQLMVVEGLKNLEKAVAQRHKEAIYALGLIIMCSGDKECINEGKKLLLGLMNTIKGEGIIKLRRKLQDLMDKLRWSRRLDVRNTNGVSSRLVHPKITCTMGELHEIVSCWEKECYYDDNVEDNVVCRECKCEREVTFFLNLLLLYDH